MISRCQLHLQGNTTKVSRPRVTSIPAHDVRVLARKGWWSCEHVLARPPALPREHTNTYSRDHQPFLASRQTRIRETTSPSSRADQHVLARPPGLPRAHTNTYSRESCESLARLSHERVKLLVSGTVYAS